MMHILLILATPLLILNILGWVNMTKHNNILTMDIARLANPGECGGRKPREERGCHLQACASNWFTGEWGTCEAACAEEGERGREVQCLLDGSPATSCRLSERPAIRENCLAACPAEEGTNGFSDIERERDGVEQREEEREEEEEELLEELLEEEEEKERKRKGFTGEQVGVVVTVIEDNIKDVLLGGQEHKSEKRTIGMFESNVGAQKPRKVEMSNEIVVEKHKKGGRGSACRDKFKNCQVILFTIMISYHDL